MGRNVVMFMVTPIERPPGPPSGLFDDNVKQDFTNYWREFLLIEIEPTAAATQAVLAVKGVRDSLASLARQQKEWSTLAQHFVRPILQAGKKGSEKNKQLACEALKQYGERFFSNFYAVNRTLSSCDNAGAPLVDWSTLELFYCGLSLALSYLPREEAPEIEETICKVTSSLLEHIQSLLQRNANSLQEASQLYFLLLHLGLPVFNDFTAASTGVLQRLYQVFGALKPSSRSVLNAWYNVAPRSLLRCHLETAQQFVAFHVVMSSEKKPTLSVLREDVGPCLKIALPFMQLLFNVNKARSNRLGTSLERCILEAQEYLSPGSLGTSPQEVIQANETLAALSLAEFYSDAVNSTEVMIRHDFIQWKTQEPLDFCLRDHAYILDAAAKSWYFLSHALTDQEQRGRHTMGLLFGLPIIQPYFVLRVRRTEIVRDALTKLTATVSQSDLKKQLKVIFDDEEGVDEGGVRKEFFQLLTEQLFNPDYGMFEYYNSVRLFWFNGASLESNLQFELIGVVLGLAIYNGVLLDVHFPLAVYKKLLGVPVGLLDFEEFKPEIARSLRRLLLMPAEDVDACALTFSVDVPRFGTVETQPLCPEVYPGDHPVTAANREEYVGHFVNWNLNASIKSQFEAFERGFMKCCDRDLLQLLFQPTELQLLICGSTLIDLEGFQEAAVYQDGYTKESQTIQELWEVVHALSQEDKKRFLFFITGSDRVPIKGLRSVQFYIGRGGSDTDRIPTAHTCFNYLLLPDYRNKEKLQKYLFLALENNTGFGLR